MATLSGNDSVLSHTNMTMAEFSQLASANGLGMGDNAIRLRPCGVAPGLC
jgi:hypothetical protein